MGPAELMSSDHTKQHPCMMQKGLSLSQVVIEHVDHRQ